MNRINLFVSITLFLVGLLCINASAFGQTGKKQQQGKGIQIAYIDSTVSPCEDFFQFANGNWLKTAVIPADRSSWGSFNEVQDRNLDILHEILDGVSHDSSAAAGSIKWKVGNYYRTGMDSIVIETQKLTPLKKEFDRIDEMKDANDIIKTLAKFHRVNVNPAFNFFVYVDYKNSDRNIVWFYQGGLGLPNRDYYTKTDERSEKLKKQYVEHVANMFKLIGEPDEKAGRDANTVMTMETRLAKVSMTPTEERDPVATYHKLSTVELDTLTPGVEWKNYFTQLGIQNINDLNVAQPAFFKELAAMIKTLPMDDWKTYFRWQLINAEAPRLHAAIVNENFRFFGTVIHGMKELLPRWKRMIESVDQAMGEALGQLYVEKAFGAKAKERAKNMVLNLKAALRDRITELDWMGEATRQSALKKIDAITIKIGYPDTWRDYSSLRADAKSYVENAMQADEFEFQRNLNKIGKPVDKTEWAMTPSTVNAYYNPNYNEIVFPAGILQPPFFDAEADDATIYGGIGFVIGHELTHGFDDEGRQFDAEGNLKDWWTADDEKNFNARAALIEKQFNDYVAIDTMHINGKLTLGENIADLGGLKISFLAFMKTLAGKPAPAPIDGFTAEQRFFLAAGQIWKDITRPETIRLRLSTDPHSPARFRIIGPLSDLPEFAKAFHCESGKMVTKEKKASIW